eukprot:203000-Chlamydomonas_euryale.AAC.1
MLSQGPAVSAPHSILQGDSQWRDRGGEGGVACDAQHTPCDVRLVACGSRHPPCTMCGAWCTSTILCAMCAPVLPMCCRSMCHSSQAFRPMHCGSMRL